MKENSSTREREQLTEEEKIRAIKITRLIARLPKEDQEKICYMITGSELLNSRAASSMHRAGES